MLISNPSWEKTTRALFERAGFSSTYSYTTYHARRNFDAVLWQSKAAPAQTVVVLHACCHNPHRRGPHDRAVGNKSLR